MVTLPSVEGELAQLKIFIHRGVVGIWERKMRDGPGKGWKAGQKGRQPEIFAIEAAGNPGL